MHPRAHKEITYKYKLINSQTLGLLVSQAHGHISKKFVKIMRLIAKEIK